MRRLSTETAEVLGPDAASERFGTGPGTPGGLGRWPEIIAPRRRDGRLALRAGGRPKPCLSADRPGLRQWRITRYLLQGRHGASLKHRARDAGGTGGLAAFFPELPWVFRPPVSRAPSDVSPPGW